VLDKAQRTDRYLAQTGRREPTARQQRRINKQARHQTAAADKAVERDTKTATS
jgi:hypothetical protein